MRPYVVAGLAMLLGGCSIFHPGSSESDFAPKSTSVYGDWVLATSPDSTAFSGANAVEMKLDPGTFSITASYPSQAPVTISGSSSLTENGMLTLVPTSGSGVPGFQAGQPVVLMASAAGNALVFIPPRRGDPTPSSVWHKRPAAVAAGFSPTH